VTHTDPEAIAGAIAVAVATAIAWQFRGRLRPTRQEFIDCLLPYVDPGEVSRRLRRARDLPPGTHVSRAAAVLGNGSRVTCQDTVPFALWSAGECINNYAEALWNTASALGDVDTTCAIVGGVVSACAGLEGVPDAWRERREELPAWPFDEEGIA
jgi:ADP-ribosylglycohydrolase